MSRTKPARVMRRTTSLSSEMEMVFTTMSSRQGKSSIRDETKGRYAIYRNGCSWCVKIKHLSVDVLV